MPRPAGLGRDSLTEPFDSNMGWQTPGAGRLQCDFWLVLRKQTQNRGPRRSYIGFLIDRFEYQEVTMMGQDACDVVDEMENVFGQRA